MELTKKEISLLIKNYSLIQINKDYDNLKNLTENPNLLCLYGNKTIDYFTFCERLNTISKGKSFYDWFNNPSIRNRESYKRFIKLKLLKCPNANMDKLFYNYFCLYNKPINIFTPLNALQIYNKYKPTSVLDPCAGWGGRLIAASECPSIRYHIIYRNRY